MQIPDEVRTTLSEALCTAAADLTSREYRGEKVEPIAWQHLVSAEKWLDSQHPEGTRGEWVQVEGETTIECGCDDDRCTAELHIDSLDGMAISIEDGDYVSTIYLPYDIRLCRKTEANSE